MFKSTLRPSASTVLLFLLAATVVFVIFAPLVSPFGRDAIDLGVAGQGPSLIHPFGTDQLGRDMVVRVAAAGRVSLAVAAGTALLTTFLALLIGLLSGYRRGLIDAILMRITDLLLGLPAILVLVVAGAFLGGGSPFMVVLVLAAFGWMQPARVIRGHISSIVTSAYVRHARQSGAGSAWVIRKHLLPSATGISVATFSITFAAALMAESTLSFLGFGVQPPVPTLGGMLRDTATTGLSYPWLALVPGIFIVMCTVLANALGESLGRQLDPLSRTEAPTARKSSGAAASTGARPAAVKPTVIPEGLADGGEPEPGRIAPPLLSVAGLSVQSAEKEILRDVTLELHQRETLAVVGKSGSGKSTLGSAILGLLPPELEMDGSISLRDGGRAGRDIGALFQDPYGAFMPSRTIGWHFRAPLGFHEGLKKTQALQRAEEWLAKVGIGDPADALRRLPGAFSGGELQRIALALALSLRPKILLADEPTASLDTVNAAAILNLLAELKKSGDFSLILITHDLGIVADRADRVVLLNGGRMSHGMPVQSGDFTDALAAAGGADLVEAAESLR